MSFMGVMPFGSLVAGSIAGKIGVQDTLLLGAACCVGGALIFALKLPMLCNVLRPVLANMEICETVKAPPDSPVSRSVENGGGAPSALRGIHR